MYFKALEQTQNQITNTSLGLSVFKGSKWKGQEIKIEEAKMDYKEREALRQQKIEERQERKRKRLARWNDSDGFHAKDMSLITDNNINNKRGWKRGRYGRAIAVMRLSKPDGTKVMYKGKGTCIRKKKKKRRLMVIFSLYLIPINKKKT